MRVLNFGSLNIDYTYRVSHITVEGETQAASALALCPGGKGLNQSVALARAGAEVFHAGAVGEDGQFLIDLLAQEGVDVRLIARRAGKSGHAMIQVDDKGRNGILVFGGANQTVDKAQIDRVLDHFGPGDLLLTQNEISCLEELIKAAHAKGMQIVLNPSPMTPELLALPLEFVSCLAVNEREAEVLCGGQNLSADEHIKKLADGFPAQDILFTLGADGAYFLPAGGVPVYEPARPVEAVDTTSAGDTFLGYFLAMRQRGTSPATAMRHAAAAASVCISRPGASASIPRLAEVESCLYLQDANTTAE